MLTITETFQAALEHAQRIQVERDDALLRLEQYRGAVDINLGIKQQLQADLEALKAALDTAVEESGARRAMLCVVTAQLGTLGQLFITCADEINKILRTLNDKGYAKPAPTSSEKEPDRSPPKTEEEPSIPFAQQETPFGRRTHLLSETTLPTPAFLLMEEPKLLNEREMNAAIMYKMSFKERKEYMRTGTIPLRLRMFGSG